MIWIKRIFSLKRETLLIRNLEQIKVVLLRIFFYFDFFKKHLREKMKVGFIFNTKQGSYSFFSFFLYKSEKNDYVLAEEDST